MQFQKSEAGSSLGSSWPSVQFDTTRSEKTSQQSGANIRCLGLSMADVGQSGDGVFRFRVADEKG